MTRSIGKWKLPQPTDIKEENEWIELDLLEKARQHVNQYSYREVANWLSKQTGRYISHVGLRKRLQYERRRKNQAASLVKWAEYAEKAIAKAQEIHTQRTGAKAEG
jgi:hypothetical protein